MSINRQDLAARLLATFLEELDEQVQVFEDRLLALEHRPDPEALKAAFRVVHTLKGAARAAGVAVIEDACHHLESILADARGGAGSLTAPQMTLMLAAADALSDASRRLKARESLEGSALARLATDLAEGRMPAAAPPRGVQVEPEPQPARMPADSAPARDEAADAPRADSTVRVRSAKLDELLAVATRLRISSGAMSDQIGDLDRVVDVLSRVSSHLDRRRGDDALRALGDEVRDAVRIARAASVRAATESRALERITDSLGSNVRSLRLRPFRDITDSLPRVVRDLAVASGKEIRLDVRGEGIEADRAVLDDVRDALLHLVRNAVDHGIELPDARVANGKPAEGRITITASLLGDRLVVEVRDDGSGVDTRRVRERMAEQGRPIPVTDADVARVLFGGGVSTRDDATTISGRGVGLDAARAAVERVRGSLQMHWIEGQGTTFTIDTPLTLATIRALLVCIGPHVIAIPTAFVSRALRVRDEHVRVADGRAMLITGASPAPLVSLARLLGPPLVDGGASSIRPALLLSSGRREIATVVDELLEEEEVVVRPIAGAASRTTPFLSGAALLSDGRVALVLNVTALLLSEHGADAEPPVRATSSAPARRRILVADDSITTRTLEQSVLEAAGYDVMVAGDGAEAWRRLQDQGADLVVADVEMPRMDGLELCENVRRSQRFRELPFILVTALEQPEHRARGLEAGAGAYLPKSSFDQETLLATIRQLLD